MSTWLKNTDECFSEHGNPSNAKSMRVYMKNQFSFYGIKTPHRKELVQRVNEEIGTPEKQDWSRRK